MNQYQRIFSILREGHSKTGSGHIKTGAQVRADVKSLATTCAKNIKAKGCTKALQDPKAKKDRISLLRSKGKL